MKELIKLYNSKYSTIDYPKNKLELYYVYLFLQNEINKHDDNELRTLFEKIEIPKPTTLKELDVYRECVDFINGVGISKTGNKFANRLDEESIRLGYHQVYEENGYLHYYLEGEDS